jgi:tetratricopeptide (TPR) repeat protein
MKIQRPKLSFLVAALMLGAAGVATAPNYSLAAEAEKEGGKREAPPIDVSTGKRLNEAIEALNAEKYNDAAAILSKLNLEKLSPYEQSRVHQIYASIANAQNNYDDARKHLAAAVASGGMNDEEISSANYQIAQLYIVEERWKEGIDALNKWFATATNPNSTAYYLLAVAYYQTKNLQAALVPAQKAVDLAETPKEGWIQLLLALRLEREEYKMAIPLLKRLIVLAPTKKTYWVQLSSVNRQIEQYDESLAVLELAHLAGLITESPDLLQLADLEAFVGVPYRAARLLDQTMAKGTVPKEQKVYEKLADAWIAAREYSKAMGPLQQAAELSPNGDLYVRLGQVYVQSQDWGPATQALQKALNKGGLRDLGSTQLLMGIAFYSEKKPKEAREWFQKAAQHEKVRKQAQSWIAHIDNELSS